MNRRSFLASLGIALAAPKAIVEALSVAPSIPAPVPLALSSATTWSNLQTAAPLTKEALTEALCGRIVVTASSDRTEYRLG